MVEYYNEQVQQPQYYPQEQNAIYQDVPVSSDEIIATELQSEKIRNIISQIAPENQLGEIEMRIRGWRKNYGNNEWIKISNDANEPHPELVSRYISYLSSIMNQSTSMSNFSSREINKLMYQIIDYLSDDLNDNAKRYGLGYMEETKTFFEDEHGKKMVRKTKRFRHDFSERTRIAQIILMSSYIVLKRAMDGGEARRLWKSLNVSESNSFGQQQKKNSFVEALKFWK